ncbi:MAG: hypothetical protein HY828_00675 [Actinobacteria bacterium]|nr:hypothetical protein [Actinomycetota bacterium]
MERFRSISRVVLLVAAAVLIPLCVLTTWADRTVYDSTTFANRTVSLLDSASVRREMGAHQALDQNGFDAGERAAWAARSTKRSAVWRWTRRRLAGGDAVGRTRHRTPASLTEQRLLLAAIARTRTNPEGFPKG